MRRSLSLFLACLMVMTSLVPTSYAESTKGQLISMNSEFNAEKDCSKGNCVDTLIGLIQSKTKLAQKDSCLPPDKVKDKEAWFQERTFSIECVKLNQEIENLILKLNQVQKYLKANTTEGECQNCVADKGVPVGLNLNNLDDIDKANAEIMCTEEKQKKIWNKCSNDAVCVFAFTAANIIPGGTQFLEKQLPQNLKKNCAPNSDSCLKQLATGFVKAVFSFFEFTWDILKAAGNGIKNGAKSVWNWLSGSEDQSSTAQLAAATASEDEGVFQMLLNDFPGTMANLWNGLLAAIKHWLSNNVFCQEWSGTPQFSECKRPATGIDCLECKTMITGMCSLTGSILAEVVPAFLIGGLINCAKHGVKAAASVAKNFKVSVATSKAIKNSKIAQVVGNKTTAITKAVSNSKIGSLTSQAFRTSFFAIDKFMLSPAYKVLQLSFSALARAATNSGTFLVMSPAGPLITYGKRALIRTGKVIIWPIDNKLMTNAFLLGDRASEKLFTMASKSKVVDSTRPIFIGGASHAMNNIDGAYAEMHITGHMKPGSSAFEEAQSKYIKAVQENRDEVITDYLKDKPNVKFDSLVADLYPELNYGKFANGVSEADVLKAENDLHLAIEKMSNRSESERLMEAFQNHLTSVSRKEVVKGSRAFSRDEVFSNSGLENVERGVSDQSIKKVSIAPEKIISNSKLNRSERLEEALRVIKRVKLKPEEKNKLDIVLHEAHKIGGDNRVFEYSWSELRKKYRILIEGGFSKDEADLLIRHGFVGRPPTRELLTPGETLFSGFADDIVEGKFLEKRVTLANLAASDGKSDLKMFVNNKGGKSGAKKIMDNFDSIYFVDYQHTVSELNLFLFGKKSVHNSDLSLFYDKKAFTNFKDTRNYLLTEKPELNKETLLKIHTSMMRGGVEDVATSDLGKIRGDYYYGNVPRSGPIDELILEQINNNPYLTWVQKKEISKGKYTGEIYYPNADYVKEEGLRKIRNSHPKLVEEIEEYQKISEDIKKLEKKLSDWKGDPSKKEKAKKLRMEMEELKSRHAVLAENRIDMTQKLVDAMVDERMAWFTRQRTEIGDINTPKKLDQYVDLVATMQRDLVSIHPLANGNGRSTREFMSYALMKEGFPPPRVIDTNADIYRTLDEWKLIVKHGILASDFLVDDMIERFKFGLPVENSLELITPYTRPPIPMALKGGGKTQPMMNGVEYIDPRVYREILKREGAKNPKLKKEMEDNPVKAWDDLHKKVEEVFARNNTYYQHPKKGIERVSLGFVDDDFKLLFGRATFADKELFDFKMKNWYSDDIVWRGLASLDEVKSETEIISMFKELTAHNASNAVLGKMRANSTAEAIRKAALQDFEKYNNDVFGEGLVKMAKDHSETGPMYNVSYGYSQGLRI